MGMAIVAMIIVAFLLFISCVMILAVILTHASWLMVQTAPAESLVAQNVR